MNKRTPNGFTLLEAVTAITILVAALGLAMTGYTYLLKKIHIASAQGELNIDVQNAIERLKKDLRLSSMDEIYGYPDTPPFTAISFPTAKIDPNTGRLMRDPDSRKILWDKTIVYHIVPGTPDKLTKSTFDYDATLTDDERQAQIDTIIESGGTTFLYAQNVESKIIFENLLEWDLSPRGGRFSCYSPTNGYETISLGYTLLDADTNTLTFTSIGRSENASGYKIGIDQIMSTPSYRFREAELRYPGQTTYDGPSAPSIIPNSSYGNRNELVYVPETNDSLSLTFDNDCWEVTDFGQLEGTGYSSRDKTLVAVDYAQNDVVVKLEGNGVSWTAQTQTADPTGRLCSDLLDPTNLVGSTVQVMMKGSGVDYGNMFKFSGERCKLTFQASTNSSLTINNVSIAESSSPSNATMTTTGVVKPVKFNGFSPVTINPGTPETSDWIDLPIDRDKNYIVSFDIVTATDLQIWYDYRANTTPQGDRTTFFTNHISGSASYAYLIPALTSLTVSYPAQGTYTSDILDTRIDNPIYNHISWKSELPSNCGLSFKLRAGDQPDLSDAVAFVSNTAFSVSSEESQQGISVAGRYVQFQAILAADTPSYSQTPVLKQVLVDWEGVSRMVNLVGKFSVGPEYGDFELSLNGKPLKAALIVNLEIYKKMQNGINGETMRISSQIKTEITPRNSGL